MNISGVGELVDCVSRRTAAKGACVHRGTVTLRSGTISENTPLGVLAQSGCKITAAEDKPQTVSKSNGESNWSQSTVLGSQIIGIPQDKINV